MPQKLAEKVSVFGFDPALGVLVPTGSRAASPAAAKAAMTRARFTITGEPELRLVNVGTVNPWTVWVVPIAPGHPWAPHPQNKRIHLADVTRDNSGTAYSDPLLWESACRAQSAFWSDEDTRAYSTVRSSVAAGSSIRTMIRPV